MRKLGTIAFVLLSLVGATLPQSSDDFTQYQGQIWVESGSDCRGETIRTEQDFHRFQARLPPTLAGKRRPAPENPDPLRTSQPWNPETEMLLVAVRSDTLTSTPEFNAVTENEKQLLVTFVLPPLPPEAYPHGWGVYRAVVVPRSEKKVTFQFIEEPAIQSR